MSVPAYIRSVIILLLIGNFIGDWIGPDLNLSFLALCIALPLAFSRVPLVPAIALFLLAVLLHCSSCRLELGALRFQEALGGHRLPHNVPYMHLFIGLGILIVLFLGRLSLEIKKRAEQDAPADSPSGL